MSWLPVQLAVVIAGELGLSVSVSTVTVLELPPSLLAVNPLTVNWYLVAGSENINKKFLQNLMKCMSKKTFFTTVPNNQICMLFSSMNDQL